MAWQLPTTCPTLLRCLSENLGTSKNKGTSLWNFVPKSGAWKFRHGKSVALSTVELFGDAYMTVDKSWLFTLSPSTVIVLFHYLDLLRIHCGGVSITDSVFSVSL